MVGALPADNQQWQPAACCCCFCWYFCGGAPASRLPCSPSPLPTLRLPLPISTLAPAPYACRPAKTFPSSAAPCPPASSSWAYATKRPARVRAQPCLPACLPAGSCAATTHLPRDWRCGSSSSSSRSSAGGGRQPVDCPPTPELHPPSATPCSARPAHTPLHAGRRRAEAGRRAARGTGQPIPAALARAAGGRRQGRAVKGCRWRRQQQQQHVSCPRHACVQHIVAWHQALPAPQSAAAHVAGACKAREGAGGIREEP